MVLVSKDMVSMVKINIEGIYVISFSCCSICTLTKKQKQTYSQVYTLSKQFD